MSPGSDPDLSVVASFVLGLTPRFAFTWGDKYNFRAVGFLATLASLRLTLALGLSFCLSLNLSLSCGPPLRLCLKLAPRKCSSLDRVRVVRVIDV